MPKGGGGLLRKKKLYICAKKASECVLLPYSSGNRGGTVVKVLYYKSKGSWFDSRWCHWNFSLMQAFRSHYSPRVDSAPNRNEYQEYLLGVKAAGV